MAGRLTPGEHLLAFLDDTFLCVSTSPGGRDLRPPWNPRAQDTAVESCRNQAHCVRSFGEGRSSCQPNAPVRRGSFFFFCPLIDKASKSLGLHWVTPDFVAQHLQAVVAEHQILLDRIPPVKDLQSAWLLLLLHCASARANNQIRSVDPVSASVTCCISSPPKPPLLETLHLCPWCWVSWVSGARSVSSWTDCIPMIFDRHPVVAEHLLRQLEGQPHLICVPQHLQPSLWKVCWAGAHPPGQP